MKKYILSIILIISLGISYAEAQNTTVLTFMQNDYLNFHLPPLDTLFRNVEKNPRITQTETLVETEKNKLKTEKRKWLSFFNIRTGYTYGVLGNYTSFSDENTPLMTTYSGNAQSSWSVGASLAIPLNIIFNMRTDVKTQKARVYSSELNRDIALDELKGQIIELYSSILSGLNIIKSKIEVLNFAKAQYEIDEKDFRLGKTTSSVLAKSKATQNEAYEAYESFRAQLNTQILKLEIISHTKLIK